MEVPERITDDGGCRDARSFRGGVSREEIMSILRFQDGRVCPYMVQRIDPRMKGGFFPSLRGSLERFRIWESGRAEDFSA